MFSCFNDVIRGFMRIFVVNIFPNNFLWFNLNNFWWQTKRNSWKATIWTWSTDFTVTRYVIHTNAVFGTREKTRWRHKKLFMKFHVHTWELSRWLQNFFFFLMLTWSVSHARCVKRIEIELEMRRKNEICYQKWNFT